MKRAVHGAFSPCPGVHAGAFLRFMGIILQYLSRCASHSFGSTSAGRANSPCAGRLPLLFRYLSTQTAFSHSVRGVSHRSDCPAAKALFRKRIAKLPSYCRIMHTIHKNELPRMGAQGESRHGRRVSTVLSGIEALKSIIRTVSWQHSVANERTPLLLGSHSGGLRPVFP